TFGGPLVKDRMFFFTSFEQRRRQESGFFTSDVIGNLTASTGIDQIIVPIPTGGNFIVNPAARYFDRITAAQAAYINSTIATGLVLVQNPATFQQGISALCIARTYAFFASSGGNTGLFGSNPLFSPNDGSNCPAISPILPSANPVGPRFILSGMPVPLTRNADGELIAFRPLAQLRRIFPISEATTFTSARLDHQINDDHRISMRFGYNPSRI